MTSMKTYGVDVCGDMVSVEWNGSVWVCPTSGAQYAHAADALRVELVAHLRACGVAADKIGAVVDDFLPLAK